jgi:hypothetical protein
MACLHDCHYTDSWYLLSDFGLRYAVRDITKSRLIEGWAGGAAFEV